LTDKDSQDLEFALKNGVDAIAVPLSAPPKM